MKRLFQCNWWMVFAICCTHLLPLHAEKDKDIEKLRRDVIAQVLSAHVDDQKVTDLMATIQNDGTWPGIDYTDVRREAFQHTKHLSNLVQLAVAYQKKDSAWKGNRKVKNTFCKGVDYWLKHDFKCENWWNNEIGTPSSFINMLLAIGDRLDKDRVEGMLVIAKRGGLSAWGARPSGDRIALAGLEAKWALFCRDTERVERMMKEIENEMKVVPAGKPGIQADYSFHHRADRVNNTLSYGLQFINVFSEWAHLVAGTRFRFTDKALQLAVDFYLDGVCKQMVYGKVEDTGILNRDITRVHKGVMSSVTPMNLLQSTAYRKNELQQVVNARTGRPFEVSSFAKFFWQTEHFVVQRPSYYTSVRMFSVRNKNMEEPYNNEGVKNHFRGDGTSYLSLNGDEYLNMAPVMDWTCIPGATTSVVDKMPDMWQIQKEGQTDFVGAVTDGIYGAVAFDFVSPHYPLKAKKSWFFFDDEYVCLGSGIRSGSKYPIVTTLNQCYLQGEVKVIDTGKEQSLSKGVHTLERATGVWHNGVGYLFPEASRIGLSNQQETGTWYAVSPRSNSSKDLKCADVFKLCIKHNIHPQNASYAYIVYPQVDFMQLKAYQQSPRVVILSNTPKLQAVEHFDKGIVYLNAYQSATLVLPNGRGSVEVDSPGMVMLMYGKEGNLEKISVADPTRKLGKLHLTLSGRHMVANNVSFAEAHYGEKLDKTYVAISLPHADEAGKSVEVKFAK